MEKRFGAERNSRQRYYHHPYFIPLMNASSLHSHGGIISSSFTSPSTLFPIPGDLKFSVQRSSYSYSLKDLVSF